MAGIIDSFEQYYAKDRKTWRKWLEKHHANTPGIWLLYYKKESDKPRVPYADAVEEALCFGWIDTTSRSIDEEKYVQLFMPRKPKSNWSKLNKERVDRLIKDGLMTPAGMERIEIAKKNGSWTKLDDVENHVLPPDLKKAFAANKKAKTFFDNLKPSPKKLMLYWLNNAKLPATRQKRIDDIIASALEGKLPSHFAR